MWQSADPALNKYLPNKDFKAELYFMPLPDGRYIYKLPGEGGVFNSINLSMYAFAAKNPNKYIDPDGEIILSLTLASQMKCKMPLEDMSRQNIAIGYAADTAKNGAMVIGGLALFGVGGMVYAAATAETAFMAGSGLMMTGIGSFMSGITNQVELDAGESNLNDSLKAVSLEVKLIKGLSEIIYGDPGKFSIGTVKSA